VEDLHHAYIAVGATASDVVALLEKRDVNVKNNPDVLTFSYSEMSVDDARALTQYAFLKSVDEHKYFIISFERVNDPAQNALLKVVEEAPGSSIFFFCTPSSGYLLPTLRSRCIELSSGSPEKGADKGAVDFLKSSYEERQECIDDLIADAKKADDRSGLRVFVRTLTDAAYKTHMPPAALRSLLDAERYLRLSGGSPKLVLSHLALVLPVL